MGSIAVRNCQRRVALDLTWLRRFAVVALEECLRACGDGRFKLSALEEVSVAIFSDRRIAKLHMDFMGIPGPTDVITFDHGDIAISADTAELHASRYAHPIDREVALYIIHGLLHLNGYDDREPRARRHMDAMQSRVLRTCLRRLRTG